MGHFAYKWAVWYDGKQDRYKSKWAAKRRLKKLQRWHASNIRVRKLH
jgi:hypothetical protein